jgi:hypothetical protein
MSVSMLMSISVSGIDADVGVGVDADVGVDACVNVGVVEVDGLWVSM